MKDMINIKLISMEDIIKAGCTDISIIIDIIRKELLRYKNNEIMLPDKTSMIFDELTQNRINCMPSYLKKENVCGVKWISIFPDNPAKHQLSNVLGTILLSDSNTGIPLALMDGTLITALRTASIGALAAIFLAHPDSRVYCSIGSGEQAKMHFIAIKRMLPSITICQIASRTIEEERAFISELSAIFPDVKFIPCYCDFAKASMNADVIVTAVSCQKPLLKADYIKPGAFYCHVGGWEDEYAVALKADKIICDNWEALKHRGSPTIARMYEEKILSDSDIYADLVDIIDGTKLGRKDNEEFIYFNSIGLSFVDIAVALYCYRKVEDKNGGKTWSIKSSDMISEYLKSMKSLDEG